jgi:DNA-binding PadR family transcriptional regulator
MGYLTSRPEAGRTRPRAVYTLTEKGERAIAEWIGRPTPFPRSRSEAVLRLLSARAADLPHRERYLRPITSLGRRMLDVHEEWLDEVDRELGR